MEWNEIVEMLRGLTFLSVVVRVLLALLVGGLLGVGRGFKKRPAGFRTYMLVCVGAALVMMTNQYVVATFGGGDMVRMGAQVISGIGFLGAGTIIVTKRNQIRGITTAAGLWAAACCGLAIGIGFYLGALIGAVTVLLIMTVMQRIDTAIYKRSRSIELYMEFEPNHKLSDFLIYARENGFEAVDIQLDKGLSRDEGGLSVVLSIEFGKNKKHEEVIEVISRAAGVSYLEEVQ